MNCAKCAATGWHSTVATIQCHVSEALSVSAATSREEPLRFLKKRRLAELDALAELRHQQSRVGPCTAMREYACEVVVTTLVLRIGAADFELLGFGEDAQVFDHKNIVGVMLGADLLALERSLEGARTPLWASAELSEAVTVFLRSEVNQQIGALRESDQALETLSARTLSGYVTPEYARRASKALASALSRTFSRAILPGAVVVGVLPAALLLAVKCSVRPGNVAVEEFGIALAIGVLASFLVERFALQRLATSLAPLPETRLTELSSHVRQRWRWILGVLMVLGGLGVSALVYRRPEGASREAQGTGGNSPTAESRRDVPRPVEALREGLTLDGWFVEENKSDFPRRPMALTLSLDQGNKISGKLEALAYGAVVRIEGQILSADRILIEAIEVLEDRSAGQFRAGPKYELRVLGPPDRIRMEGRQANASRGSYLRLVARSSENPSRDKGKVQEVLKTGVTLRPTERYVGSKLPRTIVLQSSEEEGGVRGTATYARGKESIAVSIRGELQEREGSCVLHLQQEYPRDHLQVPSGRIVLWCLFEDAAIHLAGYAEWIGVNPKRVEPMTFVGE